MATTRGASGLTGLCSLGAYKGALKSVLMRVDLPRPDSPAGEGAWNQKGGRTEKQRKGDRHDQPLSNSLRDRTHAHAARCAELRGRFMWVGIAPPQQAGQGSSTLGVAWPRTIPRETSHAPRTAPSALGHSRPTRHEPRRWRGAARGRRWMLGGRRRFAPRTRCTKPASDPGTKGQHAPTTMRVNWKPSFIDLCRIWLGRFEKPTKDCRLIFCIGVPAERDAMAAGNCKFSSQSFNEDKGKSFLSIRHALSLIGLSSIHSFLENSKNTTYMIRQAFCLVASLCFKHFLPIHRSPSFPLKCAFVKFVQVARNYPGQSSSSHSFSLAVLHRSCLFFLFLFFRFFFRPCLCRRSSLFFFIPFFFR
jgi:hypothetical protein